MKKIGFLICALTLVFGASCKQSEKKEASEVETEVTTEVETSAKKEALVLNDSLRFTAFKTPKKVGVNGTFTEINLSDYNEDKSNITDILTGAGFSIATASVNSGDPARDAKLKTFFFDNLASDKISGTFKSFDGEKAVVELQMNGVTKDVTFDAHTTDSEVTLKGSIDMIEDFTANKAFQAIHEACKVLHEDKTWTDVELYISVSK
ncbi:YceI family protein [Galbibacter mesophilus]|uniref:YceI family protein n=1 Tax=Galbibacter mesophilus TaxID=379069 RepID=UPI00191EFB13|nr:YceI family protein [Galbibacter mesophilus]MCM5664183.1 YceI family protein [Galbibacter mesophilus]